MLTPPRPITVYAKPISQQMTVIEVSIGTFFFMRIFTLVIEKQIGFQGFTRYCPPTSVKRKHTHSWLKENKGANRETVMNLIRVYERTVSAPRSRHVPLQTRLKSRSAVKLGFNSGENLDGNEGWRTRSLFHRCGFGSHHLWAAYQRTTFCYRENFW